jgi:hypothetical protein
MANTHPNYLSGLDPRALKRWNQETGERKFFIDKRPFADSYFVSFNSDPYKEDPRDAISYNIEMQLYSGLWKVRHNATMKPDLYDRNWYRIVDSFSQALSVVEKQIGETVLGEKLVETQTQQIAQAVTEWMDVPGAEHCSMRCIIGSDPEDVAGRVAFIEKTPRVRIAPFAEQNDHRNWHQGPKGSAPEYGKYEPSREWCDQELQRMGYVLAPQERASQPPLPDVNDRVSRSIPR